MRQRPIIGPGPIRMSISSGRMAIFAPSLAGGGAQRSTLKLARGLADRGYEMDLVVAQARGPFLSELPDNVRLVDLMASRVLSSLPALVRYLRNERPHAMLAVLNYANVVALWARHLSGVSVRLVVSERNTLSHSAPHSPRKRARLLPTLIRRFYPWADGIVAVSKGVADDLARTARIPRKNIRVIYNPIVTPDLPAKATAPLKDPWFEPGQIPVLLGVGRLTSQKDFPTLIQAFARVRESRQLRLVILGEGRERYALERLIAELGVEQDVRLSGFVSNPYQYMARASLFILSSRWEGLPGAVIEALFCGAPVIATDCPGGPREILADGKHGHLAPVGDVQALADAIEKSLNGTRERPSPESWKPFEIDVVVDQYVSTLLGRA